MLKLSCQHHETDPRFFSLQPGDASELFDSSPRRAHFFRYLAEGRFRRRWSWWVAKHGGWFEYFGVGEPNGKIWMNMRLFRYIWSIWNHDVLLLVGWNTWNTYYKQLLVESEILPLQDFLYKHFLDILNFWIRLGGIPSVATGCGQMICGSWRFTPMAVS